MRGWLTLFARTVSLLFLLGALLAGAEFVQRLFAPSFSSVNQHSDTPFLEQPAKLFDAAMDGELGLEDKKLLARRLAAFGGSSVGVSNTDAEQERVSALCRSLALFGLVAEANPYEAEALVAWAHVRRALGETDCPYEHTNGQYRKATEAALARAPNNANVLYAASLIYLWSGEREKAMSLFARVLRIAGGTLDDRVEFILSQLRDAEEARRVLPARYPQLWKASYMLRSERGDFFHRHADVIGELQLRAIKTVIEQPADSVEASIAGRFRALERLLDVAASDSVRRTIDSKLAELARSLASNRVAAYLKERASLRKLTVAHGYVKGDSRPSREPIAYWGSTAPLAFDAGFTSVGVFVPSEVDVALIEVKGRRPLNVRHGSTPVRVFISNDNAAWHEVGSVVKVDEYDGKAAPHIAIHVGDARARYWKIHHASSDHEGHITGTLHELVRVYGRQ